jgi:hypothetical protein
MFTFRGGRFPSQSLKTRDCYEEGQRSTQSCSKSIQKGFITRLALQNRHGLRLAFQLQCLNLILLVSDLFLLIDDLSLKGRGHVALPLLLLPLARRLMVLLYQVIAWIARVPDETVWFWSKRDGLQGNELRHCRECSAQNIRAEGYDGPRLRLALAPQLADVHWNAHLSIERRAGTTYDALDPLSGSRVDAGNRITRMNLTSCLEGSRVSYKANHGTVRMHQHAARTRPKVF